MKNQIENLIHQVAILNSKNEEIAKATGARFNIFKICGVNHYENTHSAILAELLNPEGTHGLKASFLTAFIETLGTDFSLSNFNVAKAKVKTEMSTQDGRIDIAIVDDAEHLVIIENKVYANDQYKQLIRYNTYAKENFKAHQILYLTLFGNNASEQSADKVAYLPIAYSETILIWLEKCVKIASCFPVVRETIVQYINHIKQLTNQDMDYINNEDITKVLASANQLKAVKVIVQNYHKIFAELAEQHFNPIMKKFCDDKGLAFYFVKAEEGYIRFEVRRKEWGENFCIGFSYDNTGYYYGIKSNPVLDYFSGKEKEVFKEVLKNKGYQNVKISNWWPVYAYRRQLTIDDWEELIIASNEFAKDCQIKINDLLEVISSVKKINHLE